MVINLNSNPLWQINYQEWKEGLAYTVQREIDIFCVRSFLKKIQFFRLDLNFTLKLLPRIQILRYKSREIVFRKGDPADEIFFIVQGEIELHTQLGAKLLTLASGTILGEQELFDKGKLLVTNERTYFAIARTPTTLIVCDAASFR
jgi:CRP-like cAMP-binding protein